MLVCISPLSSLYAMDQPEHEIVCYQPNRNQHTPACLCLQHLLHTVCCCQSPASQSPASQSPTVQSPTEQSPVEQSPTAQPSTGRSLVHILPRRASLASHEPASQELIDAITSGDLVAVSNHLTPNNANSILDTKENVLAFALRVQTDPLFILGFIKLLEGTHAFIDNIVETLLLTQNTFLMQMFIYDPDLVTIDCDDNLPIQLYSLYQEHRISYEFAIAVALGYCNSDVLPQELRVHFALIFHIIRRGSIESIMEHGHEEQEFIHHILFNWPELIIDHQFYIANTSEEPRPLNAAEYAAHSFRQGFLNRELMYVIIENYLNRHHESHPNFSVILPNAVDDSVSGSDDAAEII